MFARQAPLPTEVIRRSDEGELLLVQAASLQVTAGPDRGRRCALRQGLARVGTAADNDLVLTDPAVSQHQLELSTARSGFVLRDLDSTNGTFVSKLRVERVVLTDAAVIEVGRTRIKFAPRREQERLPLSPRHRFGALYGKSPLMRHCFALLERAARTDATVLVGGESGTGKELAARALHQASPRGAAPFVVFDCGAVSSELLESELFGHERGAYTGASDARPGAVERAAGGTLFLDEIGELALELQPKLLRLLEAREVRRVGADDARTVDLRLVAATNRRLDERVAEGAFREDLYYRLAVIRVELPPLRRRAEDIPLLALELARQLRPDVDPATWLDESALEALGGHHWPGNVRELRNVIERLALLPELPPEALVAEGGGGDDAPPPSALASQPYHQAKERVLDLFERQYVSTVLAEERGVVARAAKRAGVPRQTFFRLIRKHGLRQEEGP